MDFKVVYPPNIPMDRSYVPRTDPVMYDEKFFVDINSTGKVIVGSSSICDSYWEGTLFLYENTDLALNNTSPEFYFNEATTGDAKFLNDSTIVIGEDVPNIKILTIATDYRKSPITLSSELEVSDRIERISVWKDDLKVVTCGGNSINVWDLANGDLKKLEQYNYYHTNKVTSVDVSPVDSNVFVSTSRDRRLVLWDIRMECPASVLYENGFCGLTSASFVPRKENRLVVGTEAGDLYQIDIKQPGAFLNTKRCFNHGIYRTLFNKTGELAVCGDCTEVLVYTLCDDSFKNIYSEKCKGIVRGLAWAHDRVLYSCGFEKGLNEHTIKV